MNTKTIAKDIMACVNNKGKLTKTKIVIECWNSWNLTQIKLALDKFVASGEIIKKKNKRDKKFYYSIPKG